MDVRNIIINSLKVIIKDLQNNNSILTQEECSIIINIIKKSKLNKEDACQIFEVSPDEFNTAIANNVIPNGIKDKNNKELLWYYKDLVKLIK